MRKTILKMAAGLMLALPTMAMAEEAATPVAINLSEAFTLGSMGGHLGLYGQQLKIKEAVPGDPDRFGFAAGSASLTYETAELHGISLGLGAWGSTRLYQRNSADEMGPDGDYREAIGDDALIHQAFVRYRHEGLGSLSVGRQEIDLAWLTDYIQGATASLSPMEGLALTFGWAKRQAVVDFDEVSRGFGLMNGNRGLSFLEAKYTPVAGLELTPYYYHADELFAAPGLKVSYTLKPVAGLDSVSSGQFVTVSTEAASGVEDGDLLWLSQELTLGDAGFGGGYLVVDRAGSGEIERFGDQQPFEEGNRIFAPDAKTWYVNASYALGDLALGLIYGQTRYLDGGERQREKELNLSVEYALMKGLSLGLLYARVDHDDPTVSYQAIKSLLQYKY